MKYTKDDLYAGMKLRCTDNKGFSFWTKGRVYEVQEEESGGTLFIASEEGRKSYSDNIISRLSGDEHNAEFEVVAKVVKSTDYTEEDLEEGMLFHCKNDMSFPWWVTGQTYEIYKDERGLLFTKAGDNNPYCAKEIVARLNGSASGSFELLERLNKTELEKKVEAKIRELKEKKRRLFDKQQEIKIEENEVAKEINKLSEALKAIEVLKEFE